MTKWAILAALLLAGCDDMKSIVESPRADLEKSKAAYQTCLSTKGANACDAEMKVFQADLDVYNARVRAAATTQNGYPCTEISPGCSR